MADDRSCECLNRVAKAGARRREAEDVKRRAVDDLHRAVMEAIDAPGCSHSQRAVAQAAGLSLGGIHNALLSAPSLYPASWFTSEPVSSVQAREEPPPEPRKSGGSTRASD